MLFTFLIILNSLSWFLQPVLLFLLCFLRKIRTDGKGNKMHYHCAHEGFHIFYFYLVDVELPPLKLLHSFCALKPDNGPCRAMIKQFFFNIHTQQCEEFMYGGCEGNQNRFATLEDCQEKCIEGRFLETLITQEPRSSFNF